MHSFPVSLLPFLGILNLFGDVIITVINGYICPSANVTIDIQSTMIPKWWIPQLDRSRCHPCGDWVDDVRWVDINQITFYSNTDKEITSTEAIQFVNPPYIPRYLCQSRSSGKYNVLDHMGLIFQMSSNHSVTDQLIGINVPWVWVHKSFLILPQISIQKSKLHLKIEQKANYSYDAESLTQVNCTSNLTYNITVTHDCASRKETRITETTRTKSHLTTTKIPKTKANNNKNEKPTKKKIDPRLINCLAVSGSAVIIATVVSLVMYFGWYKRKLNQLGLIPQNATPAQN